MKPTFRKALLWVLAGFFLLFFLRLGYGYLQYPDGKAHEQYNHNSDYSVDFDFDKKNYASSKYDKGGNRAAPAPSGVSVATPPKGEYDQKYEKVGTMSSRTDSFERDNKKVRDIIKQYNGLIQYELQSGLKGSRYMHLAVGIPPDNFDAAVDAMKQVGKLTGIRVDKSDKTNEFQKLSAVKATLEAHLNALMALKGQSGKIEEYMNLESKIEDINSQLQNLGVSLGEFDSQNEFCTVKFTLSEVKYKNNIIPLYSRLYHAFTFTVRYYGTIMLTLFLGAGFVLIAAKAVEVIKRIIKQKLS